MYSNLRTSADSASAAGKVVQLYVSQLNSAVERPVKELRGFERIQLDQKEIIAVRLALKGVGFDLLGRVPAKLCGETGQSECGAGTGDFGEVAS